MSNKGRMGTRGILSQTLFSGSVLLGRGEVESRDVIHPQSCLGDGLPVIASMKRDREQGMLGTKKPLEEGLGPCSMVGTLGVPSPGRSR